MPIDILCSASTVWRERLKLAGSLSPTPRAEETCTTEEIKSFVAVMSVHTQETVCAAKELSFGTLIQALPLLHKYDCIGSKQMLDELDNVHFSSVIGVKSLKCSVYTQTLNAVVQSPSNVTGVTEPWLTQEHLDYLMLKQELYCEGNAFPKGAQQLLVSLLAGAVDSSMIQPHGTHFKLKDGVAGIQEAQVKVVLFEKKKRAGEESAEMADAEVDDSLKPLVFEAWRLTATTYSGLMPYLKPKDALP